MATKQVTILFLFLLSSFSLTGQIGRGDFLGDVRLQFTGYQSDIAILNVNQFGIIPSGTVLLNSWLGTGGAFHITYSTGVLGKTAPKVEVGTQVWARHYWGKGGKWWPYAGLNWHREEIFIQRQISYRPQGVTNFFGFDLGLHGALTNQFALQVQLSTFVLGLAPEKVDERPIFPLQLATIRGVWYIRNGSLTHEELPPKIRFQKRSKILGLSVEGSWKKDLDRGLNTNAVSMTGIAHYQWLPWLSTGLESILTHTKDLDGFINNKNYWDFLILPGARLSSPIGRRQFLFLQPQLAINVHNRSTIISSSRKKSRILGGGSAGLLLFSNEKLFFELGSRYLHVLTSETLTNSRLSFYFALRTIVP